MTSSSSSSFLPNDSTPTPALLVLPYGYSNGRQRGGFHFALGNNQVIYMTSSDSAGSASLPKLRLFSFAPVLITFDNWPPIFFKHRFSSIGSSPRFLTTTPTEDPTMETPSANDAPHFSPNQ